VSKIAELWKHKWVQGGGTLECRPHRQGGGREWAYLPARVYSGGTEVCGLLAVTTVC
jgi:hypothetical protein